MASLFLLHGGNIHNRSSQLCLPRVQIQGGLRAFQAQVHPQRLDRCERDRRHPCHHSRHGGRRPRVRLHPAQSPLLEVAEADHGEDQGEARQEPPEDDGDSDGPPDRLLRPHFHSGNHR